MQLLKPHRLCFGKKTKWRTIENKYKDFQWINYLHWLFLINRFKMLKLSSCNSNFNLTFLVTPFFLR